MSIIELVGRGGTEAVRKRKRKPKAKAAPQVRVPLNRYRVLKQPLLEASSENPLRKLKINSKRSVMTTLS